MNWADLANGLYETLAGIFLAISCCKLYHDKRIMGWSIGTQLFFTTWAYWNIFFYAHLNQWISWVGGLFVVFFNSLWTGMAIYYTRKNKKLSKLSKLKDAELAFNQLFKCDDVQE